MKYFLVIDESRRNPICGLGGYFISERNLKNLVHKFQDFKKEELKIKTSSPIKWSLPKDGQRGAKKFSDIINSLKKQNISDQQFREKVLNFISSIEGLEPICVILHDLRARSDHLSVDDLYIWGFRFILQSAFFFAKEKGINNGNRFSLIVLKDIHKFKDFYIEYKNFYYRGNHFSYIDRNTGEQKYVDYEPLESLNFFESLTEARSAESISIQISDFIIGSLVYYCRAGFAQFQNKSEKNKKTKFQAIKIVKPLIKTMKNIYKTKVFGRGIKVHPKTTDLYSWLKTVNFYKEFEESNNIPGEENIPF